VKIIWYYIWQFLLKSLLYMYDQIDIIRVYVGPWRILK
jgi:hypothetical protein